MNEKLLTVLTITNDLIEQYLYCSYKLKEAEEIYDTLPIIQHQLRMVEYHDQLEDLEYRLVKILPVDIEIEEIIETYWEHTDFLSIEELVYHTDVVMTQMPEELVHLIPIWLQED